MADRIESKAILIAAGGTGGHVFPALAVAEHLQLRDIPVVWLGTHKGLESRVVPQAGIKFLPLSVSGFRGKGVVERVQAIFSLFGAIFKVTQVIRKERVGVVLGMGGYASVAAGLASTLCRRPLVVQEQNAVPGTANRLLARFASKIFTGFPVAMSPAGKVEFSGNPVRQQLLDAAVEVGSTHKPTTSDQFSITIIGGSQGAKAINELIPGALARLCSLLKENSEHAGDHILPINVRHQSGVVHKQAVCEAYRQIEAELAESIKVSVLDFIDDMQKVLSLE